jgi:hypothetical protein
MAIWQSIQRAGWNSSSPGSIVGHRPRTRYSRSATSTRMAPIISARMARELASAKNALTNTCRHSDMQQARTNSSTIFVLPTTMFLRNVLLWLKAATYHVSSGSKTCLLHGRLSQLRKCKPNIRRRLFPIPLVRDTPTIPHQDQVELASRGASHS